MNTDLASARAALLHTGVLRAAINFGNPVLAQKGPEGEAQGVSVRLAQELASRLDARLRLIPYPGAGKVVDAAPDNIWDIAFLAIDPLRAREIIFTSPYVVIEGTYLVREQSGFKQLDELDAPGVRIAVGRGAAYDLYLSRALQHAELVRADTSAKAVDLFLEQSLEAAAGVRQPLEAVAKAQPGLKVMPGAFTQIRQAMATPLRSEAALPYLETFIREMGASGFVAAALQHTARVDT